MKKYFKWLLMLSLAFTLPGCVAVLAGSAGAAAAYWYTISHHACSHCTKQISTQASVCPHCKRDVQPKEALSTPYRETAFGKVVCIHCRELIGKKAAVCPKCNRDIEPLKEGEPTRDVILKKVRCPSCEKHIPDQSPRCPNCQKELNRF